MTDVLDGLQIKLECGPSIHWPHRQGFELHANVLVFWDYTRARPKAVVRERDIDKNEVGIYFEKEEQIVPNMEELGPEHDDGTEEAYFRMDKRFDNGE